MYINVCTQIDEYVLIFIFICIFMYIYTYLYLHSVVPRTKSIEEVQRERKVCEYEYVYAQLFANMEAYEYLYIHMHTYIFIHKYTYICI
jgi:hypothetical protein